MRVNHALDSLTRKRSDSTSSPISQGKLWSMKPIIALLLLCVVFPSFWLGAQTPFAGNHQRAENAAVKYLRADASLRQSYPLPADAVPNLQKSVESPLDVEDEKLVVVAVAEIRSRLRFRDGDIPGAIDDAVAAMAAARHLSVDGSLASVLFAALRSQ